MQRNEKDGYRERLLRQNFERAEVSYLKSRDRGDATPAVMVLDPLDPRGAAIAATSGAGERIAALLAEAARRGAFPILTAGLPRGQVQDLIAAEFPDEPWELDAVDVDGRYLVVVVAEGGITLFAALVPE